MLKIVEILNLIKNDFEINSLSGLCSTASKLYDEGLINGEEYYMFTDYYDIEIQNQEVFYTYRGDTTNNKGQFAWPPYKKEGRIRWLCEHITKNTI